MDDAPRERLAVRRRLIHPSARVTPADDHPDLNELERAVMQAGVEREKAALDDAEHKRSHGIVHTPPLLARAMAMRVDEVLKRGLGRSAGLADAKVSVVDPSCGPGAFLAACESIARDSKARPAGYLGWDLDDHAVALAESILRGPFESSGFPLLLRSVDTLAERPLAAVAKGGRTAVVIGNPPWASKSKSRGQIVSEGMLADFRREPDGSPLREKKIGVLSDDYVRFVRWGAEVVRQSPGGGVLAVVTNSSWLDGPVHRGMRACLLRWFATIDVYDLGGSALIAREPGRDDNVFGVRPGVAVLIASRPAKHGELVEGARVRYVRLRGSRTEKLDALSDPGLALETLVPHGMGFSFRRTGARIAVPDSVALDEAMPFHREGVQTNRDQSVIADTAAELVDRMNAFVAKSRRADVMPLREASGHYDPEVARERVAELLLQDPDGSRGLLARRIAYRPFVPRYFVPVAPLCHRPRPDLLDAMDRSGFAVVSVRKDRSERAWTHVAAVNSVPDNCFLSNRSSCRARAFPTHGPDGSPNFDPAIALRVGERVGRTVDSESFALYVLGVLGSSSYRRRHDALLRDAPPHIPLPRDARTFAALVAAGKSLLSAFLDPTGEADAVIGHYAIDYAPASLALAENACEAVYAESFDLG